MLRNPFGALQALGWLLVHPDAWKAHFATLDLNPTFCFAEIGKEHFRKRALWQMVAGGHIVSPLILLTPLTLLAWKQGRIHPDTFVLPAACVVAGIITSTMFSFAAGLLLGNITSSALLIVSDGSLTAICVVLAASLGLISGITTSLANDKQHSLPRRLLAVPAGILLSVLSVLTIGVVAWGCSQLFSQKIEDVSLVALFPALFAPFAVTIGLRSRRWIRAFVLELLSLPVFWLIVIILDRADDKGLNLEQSLSIGFCSVCMSAGVCWFTLNYVIAERIGNSHSGVAAAMIVTVGPMIVLVSLKSLFREGFWGLIALALTFLGGGPEFEFWGFLKLLWRSVVIFFLPVLAAAVLGMTQKRWRPVLTYPLEALWDLALYFLDKNRTGAAPKFLRWNTAFWNQFQLLPAAALHKHLELYQAKNVMEVEGARQYLAEKATRVPTRSRRQTFGHVLVNIAGVALISIALLLRPAPLKESEVEMGPKPPMSRLIAYADVVSKKHIRPTQPKRATGKRVAGGATHASDLVEQWKVYYRFANFDAGPWDRYADEVREVAKAEENRTKAAGLRSVDFTKADYNRIRVGYTLKIECSITHNYEIEVRRVEPPWEWSEFWGDETVLQSPRMR